MERINAQYDRWFETKDGRFIGYLFHGLNFRSKVEITENGIDIINEDDEDYQGNESPSIYELKKSGEVIEKLAFEEYAIIYKRKTELNDKDIRRIAKRFSKHGFKVTEDAIRHNYKAYKRGDKSGYRDKRNGYHLFSLCCLNNLSFYATTLCKQSSDWQTTYEG